MGYSFGAWVAARALLQGVEAAGAVLISPPVAFMEMTWLPQMPHLKLMVAGDRDEICPLLDLQAMMAEVKPPVEHRGHPRRRPFLRRPGGAVV